MPDDGIDKAMAFHQHLDRRSHTAEAGMTKTIAFLLLTLLTAVTYMNTLPGEFIFDDQHSVVQNAGIRNLSSWTVAARPLTDLTYAIDFKLHAKPVIDRGKQIGWTIEPFWFKATNILLHAVNACLVLLILSTLFPSGLAPFAGAALFAVHPVFLQAVGYISGRSSVLCATFYFGAILCGLKAARWSQARSFIVGGSYRFGQTLKTKRIWQFEIWIALTSLLVAGAWFSKQEAVALPLFLFALYALRRGKYVYRLATVTLVVLLLAYGQIAPTLDGVAKNEILVDSGFDPVLPFATYVPTYFTALTGYYYAKFLLPTNLTIDPAYIESSFVSPRFLVALAILGLAILLFRKSSFAVKFGILAILVSPLSVYAFVPMADPIQGHRAYIAGLGVAVLFAAFTERLQVQVLVWKFIVAGTIVTLSIVTIHQNETWNQNLTLWKHATEVNPNKGRAWMNLGFNQPNWMPAVSNYETAIRVQPTLWAAHSNLASAYMDHGHLTAGAMIAEQVTKDAPNFSEAFINLGVARMRQGRLDESIAAFDRALELKPDSPFAVINRQIAVQLKGSK